MFRRPALFLLVCSLAPAQIQYQESRKIFLLTTSQSSYAMGVAADGALRNLYWGAPLWRVEDLNPPSQQRDLSSFDPRQMLDGEESQGWGGPRYYEPALKITRENGDRGPGAAIPVAPVSARNGIWISCFGISAMPSRSHLHYHVYPDYEDRSGRSADHSQWGTGTPLTVERTRRPRGRVQIFDAPEGSARYRFRSAPSAATPHRVRRLRSGKQKNLPGFLILNLRRGQRTHQEKTRRVNIPRV